jgi:D-threonate/D-erythronate kinase
MRLGIQADDLTGACDTGAVFAARGLATIVLLPEARFPASLPDVLAVDTESRGRAAPDARAAARRAVARLAAAGPALLYKKVDSTLRGALAAELGGALEGAGDRRAALLAPALPAQGRTVVDGMLRVGGRPWRRRWRGTRDFRRPAPASWLSWAATGPTPSPPSRWRRSGADPRR